VEQIPIWRMIALSAETLHDRAEAICHSLQTQGIAAIPQPGESTIGGGSLPGETLPTWHIAIAGADAATQARRLRLNRPPVIGRVLRDQLLLDLRTVAPEDDTVLGTAVARVVAAKS
jgi:L-seryl-tRNA(Ser) seleniumtransferase